MNLLSKSNNIVDLVEEFKLDGWTYIVTKYLNCRDLVDYLGMEGHPELHHPQ